MPREGPDRGRKVFVRTFILKNKNASSSFMDNIHNKVAQLENAGVNASCQTFAMANAERFPQIVDRTKLLATYDLVGSFDFVARERLLALFPTSYSSFIRLNTFHTTRNMISAFSSLALFCGTSTATVSSCSTPAEFQQADPMLQHAFILQFHLIGKVFGSNVVELHFCETIAGALYSTHECLVHLALVSLTACIALNNSRARTPTTSTPSTACCS